MVRCGRPIESRLGAPRFLSLNTVHVPAPAAPDKSQSQSQAQGGDGDTHNANAPGTPLIGLLSGGGVGAFAGSGPMLRLLETYCAQSEQCSVDRGANKRRSCCSCASSLVLYDPSALEGYQRELALKYQ